MAQSGQRLSRELNIWETIGISLAMMAPSMAANINPQGMVGDVGAGIPLAFAVATVGVALVAWSFVRLCQRYNHSGSVYGFVGVTLGPRAGTVAGWCLLGTYLFYGVVCCMAAGQFGSALLDSLGLVSGSPDWLFYVIGAIVLVAVWRFSIAPVQKGTRALIIVEGVTIALIAVVCLMVIVSLAGGSDTGDGQGLTLEPFTMGSGVGGTAVFSAVVYGFLSFAGFESSATLGEETKEPRRDIPRAVLGTALFGGLFYVVVTWVEVMGFGTSADGLANFGESGSLLGDLGTTYVGAWVGDLISLGATISAIGCTLACVVSSARLLFALSRDGILPAGLASVSPTRRTPVTAASTACIVMFVLCVLMALTLQVDPGTIWGYTGTIGTLLLLIAYLFGTVGAMRLMFFSGRNEVPKLEIVVPVIGLLFLAYTLFTSAYPFPTGTDLVQPVVTAVWFIIAVAVVVARPQMAREAGNRLSQDEGLHNDAPAAKAPAAGGR